MEERYAVELSRAETVLDAVEGSLGRLSDGTYGSCQVCGDALTEVDLDNDPTADRCGAHRDRDLVAGGT
jgi:RNA polymerase-binding transcription factor DksA